MYLFCARKIVSWQPTRHGKFIAGQRTKIYIFRGEFGQVHAKLRAQRCNVALLVGWVLAPTRIASYHFSMTWYRRRKTPGGMFFFTVVTHQRRRILTCLQARECLRCAIMRTQENYPFESIAMVLLPDHLHCIWELPPDDSDFSTRWRLIKTRFTRSWLPTQQNVAVRSASRHRSQEHAVWGRRFWEHQIRDDQDLKRHLDYIHYNPVKHGHVAIARDWAYSTFNKFVAMKEYEIDWGQAEPDTLGEWTEPNE